MKSLVDERASLLGEYIVENNATVRAAAKVFGISKSTVHMDVSKLQIFKILQFIILPIVFARYGKKELSW